jgi:terminase large subunit-like protein
MKNEDREKEALQLLSDPNWRLQNLYKIKTKDARLAKFKFNRVQQDYRGYETSKDMILKARQLGFSTLKLIEKLDYAITTENTSTAIVAHKENKVQTLFEIVRLAFQHLPNHPAIKPRVSYDNRNELYFPDLNSKIYVAMDTRSETVHNLHISEVAFIADAERKLLGILESVPDDGGIISLESTANGTAGYFYEEWENKDSEFKKHFYNWTWEEGYQTDTEMTIEQLNEIYYPYALRYGLIKDIAERYELTPEQFNWYIKKVIRNKDRVMQEYPTSPLEAFISSGRNVFYIGDLQKQFPKPPIDRKWVDLIIWEKPLEGFRYSMGVDTAEGEGNDNAVISVWNANTGEQAAEFASPTTKPDILAGIAMEIGTWYNKALMVPEINSSGLVFVSKVKGKYGNLYMRETFDKRTKETKKQVGWRTTAISKPLMVSDFEETVREEGVTINSQDLLKEMKTFVRTDETLKSGYGADGSNQDDRVMAAMLAFQGMKNTPMIKVENEAEKRLKAYLKFQSGKFPLEEQPIFNILRRPKGQLKRNYNPYGY